MTAAGEPFLVGRRALVVGGSRGIGAAIVRRLASHGAQVAFTYHASADQADSLAAEHAAGLVVPIQADSADGAALITAIHQAATTLGGLDILINNAAVAHIEAIDTFPLDEFDRMIAVNVRAVFVAIQTALAHMTSGGRIITIGSINADRIPYPQMAVYAMTKAAVAALSRGLARDLGGRGITVNVVQPGPISTDMNPGTGEVADRMRDLTALGAYGRPEDVAEAVAYLAGAQSGYVTGATWDIDGGYGI